METKLLYYFYSEDYRFNIVKKTSKVSARGVLIKQCEETVGRASDTSQPLDGRKSALDALSSARTLSSKASDSPHGDRMTWQQRSLPTLRD